ncbi:MAG TPA: hypothetical protein VIM42_01510 [Clostridium sp.]
MKAFGFVSCGNTLIGYVSTDLHDIIVLMFSVVFSIILANKLVAGYVDRGSIMQMILLLAKE